MNQLDDKQACDRLLQAGFTASEIDRLRRPRQDYAEKEMRQTLADCRRLKFARWLVTTGKLTDLIT